MWGDIVVGSVKYHDSHGPKERFKPLRQFRTTKISLDGRINTSKLKFWGLVTGFIVMKAPHVGSRLMPSPSITIW